MAENSKNFLTVHSQLGCPGLYLREMAKNLQFHTEFWLYTPIDQYRCKNGGHSRNGWCDLILRQFHEFFQLQPIIHHYWSNPRGNFESLSVIPDKK